ncbi:MAG: alpha/beta hydrolase [SAR202 cluster bacterium]|nr:alpha/beta hydrolase [SAR202 cluster bacterium]
MPNSVVKAVFKECQVDADGCSIRYWEAGQGRPVIMLESTGWRQSMLHDTLAEKYRIISLELPGTGDSPANTSSKSIGDLAATAAKAVATITAERYTLIGTSFGAHVALWQALQAPEQVEALILVSPTAIKPLEVLAKATAQEVHQSMFAHPENAEKHPALSQEIFAKEQELVGRLTSGAHDAVAESRLGEIRCPTLAIFGQQDRFVSPEAARVYKENIANSNIAIVYDAGHCIIGDRPEALVNSVSDYAEHWETFIVGHQTGLINP